MLDLNTILGLQNDAYESRVKQLEEDRLERERLAAERAESAPSGTQQLDSMQPQLDRGVESVGVAAQGMRTLAQDSQARGQQMQAATDNVRGQTLDLLSTLNLTETVETNNRLSNEALRQRQQLERSNAEFMRAKAEKFQGTYLNDESAEQRDQRQREVQRRAERLAEFETKRDTSGMLGKLWYGARAEAARTQLLQAEQSYLSTVQTQGQSAREFVGKVQQMAALREGGSSEAVMNSTHEYQLATAKLEEFNKGLETADNAARTLAGIYQLNSAQTQSMRESLELLRDSGSADINAYNAVLNAQVQRANLTQMEEANKAADGRKELADTWDEFARAYEVGSSFEEFMAARQMNPEDQQIMKLGNTFANYWKQVTTGANDVAMALVANADPRMEMTGQLGSTLTLAKHVVDTHNADLRARLSEQYNMTDEEITTALQGDPQSAVAQEYFRGARDLNNQSDLDAIQKDVNRFRTQIKEAGTADQAFSLGLVEIPPLDEWLDTEGVAETLASYGVSEEVLEWAKSGDLEAIGTRLSEVNTDLDKITQNMNQVIARVQGSAAERDAKRNEIINNYSQLLAGVSRARFTVANGSLPQLNSMVVNVHGTPVNLSNADELAMFFQQKLNDINSKATRHRGATPTSVHFGAGFKGL